MNIQRNPAASNKGRYYPKRLPNSIEKINGMPIGAVATRERLSD
jgi:hypothetical protein